MPPPCRLVFGRLVVGAQIRLVPDLPVRHIECIAAVPALRVVQDDVLTDLHPLERVLRGLGVVLFDLVFNGLAEAVEGFGPRIQRTQNALVRVCKIICRRVVHIGGKIAEDHRDVHGERPAIGRAAQIGVVVSGIGKARRLVRLQIGAVLLVGITLVPRAAVCRVERLERPLLFGKVERQRLHGKTSSYNIQYIYGVADWIGGQLCSRVTEMNLSGSGAVAADIGGVFARLADEPAIAVVKTEHVRRDMEQQRFCLARVQENSCEIRKLTLRTRDERGAFVAQIELYDLLRVIVSGVRDGNRQGERCVIHDGVCGRRNGRIAKNRSRTGHIRTGTAAYWERRDTAS